MHDATRANRRMTSRMPKPRTRRDGERQSWGRFDETVSAEIYGKKQNFVKSPTPFCVIVISLR
jgi:hypothetical protein